MKRILAAILASFTAMALFVPTAYGDETPQENTLETTSDAPEATAGISSESKLNVELSSEEKEAASYLMQARDMQAPQEFAVLYNHNDIPKFILAWSETGYLIADRDSWKVLEYAEGPHPYTGYETVKNYYGGFGAVYVEAEEGFFNPLTGTTSNTMGYIETIDNLGTTKSALPTEALLTKANNAFVHVPDHYDFIQRLSFGHNTTNTCSAVAVGIVLNYLDRTVSDSFVPSNMESKKMNKESLSSYSSSVQLHNFLVNDCGMTGPNLGTLTCSGVDNYRKKAPGVANTNVSLDFDSFTFSTEYNYSFLKNEIDAGKPGLITTLPILDDEYSKFSNHTMVAYGYRTNEDGTLELCLHSGWGGDYLIEAGKETFYAKKIYFPAELATYVYRFEYKLTGWHNTPSGQKYFNSNGSELTLPVDRLFGTEVHDTAAAIARFDRNSAKSVVIVSGAAESWQDAACAAGMARLVNGPILTTNKDSLPASTRRAIQDLGVQNVYIVGGSAVVSNGVKNTLAYIPGVTRVDRYYGEDGYETAEAVYRSLASHWLHPAGGYKHAEYEAGHTWKNGSKKKVAIITSGEIPDDSAAAATLSSYTHSPVFFAKHNGTLTEETKSILKNGRFDEVFCVGGTVQKAAGVACELVDPADITGASIYGKPREYFVPGQNWYSIVFGTTAYDTAAESFNTMVREGASPSTTAICSGKDRTDAYAGAALGIPLLLADSTSQSAAKTVIKDYAYRINKLAICGGTVVVPDSIVESLEWAWLTGRKGSPSYLNLNEAENGSQPQGEGSTLSDAELEAKYPPILCAPDPNMKYTAQSVGSVADNSPVASNKQATNPESSEFEMEPDPPENE